MITDYFNELTKSSAEAYFLLTPAGEILAVNPSSARMLGTDHAILAGQRIADLVTDPDETLSRYMRLCLRNREPVPGALHWRTKEGLTTECLCNGHLLPPGPEGDGRLILLRCKPKETENNKFIALNKTLEQLKASYHALKAQSEVLKTEITERKQAEAASRESQERIITILDSLDAIVYVADMKTYELIFANKYVRDLFGNIEGKICWQAIQTGQTAPCDFCTNNRIVDAEGNPTDTYRWEFQNTRTGRWYYILDRAIRWVDGRTVRLEIATDITERKRIEENLLVTQFSVDNSADAIFWVRPDGSFSYSNRAASALLGYSSEDFLRLKTFDLSPSHQGAAWQEHWETLSKHKYSRLETLLVKKDGSRLPVEITANHLEFNEKEYSCSFVRDITERKKAEESLHILTGELEQRVSDRTAELMAKNAELEKMNRLFVGRELRMAELKERIRELEQARGQQPQAFDGSGSTEERGRQ
jgi:PAS domain S-box-containing protein